MKKFIVISFIFSLLITPFLTKAQGSLCNGATLSCSGNSLFTFPAGVSSPATTGQPGPNYGCLGTTPNPAWYYMQITQSGDINIEMHTTPQRDIDFICWGPFPAPVANACTALLTGSTPSPGSHHASGPGGGYPTLNTIDCSYDPSWQEWCYIPNAQVGQYYILLITNYSNQACDISFSQISGNGASGCNPDALNNGPICEGDTLKLTASSPSPNPQYYWSGPNNFSSSLQNPVIPNATTANSGDYSVITIVGSTFSQEDVTTAIIHPKPNLTLNADTICIGQSASLLASGANTYVWSPGGTANPLNVSPTVSTNYTVIGTTTFGCKDTTTTFITVNPKPVVTATSAAICALDSATITASGAATYLWSNGFNTPQIKVSPSLTTTYKVIGISAQNCVDSTTTTVTVNPNPNITINDVDICAGKTAQLSVLNGSASDTYQWSNGNTGDVIIVSPPATTLFWVNATDINGCKDSDSAFVNIHAVPSAQFMADPNKATTENPTINFVDQSTNADIWKWTFGESFAPNNTSALQSPAHTYNGVGEYIIWLYVQSTFGCRDSIHHSVIIENPYAFYIPNAFSPNSINIENTTFKAKGIGIDNEKYEMLIYDRWGKVIFETKDMDAGWNGKLNNTGEFVPSGVYVYYIRFKQKYGVEKEFCGHVTLF